jgi:hypothetical protein
MCTKNPMANDAENFGALSKHDVGGFASVMSHARLVSSTMRSP